MNLGNQRPNSVRNRVATIDSQASSELSILSSDQVEKNTKTMNNKEKMESSSKDYGSVAKSHVSHLSKSGITGLNTNTDYNYNMMKDEYGTYTNVYDQYHTTVTDDPNFEISNFVVIQCTLVVSIFVIIVAIVLSTYFYLKHEHSNPNNWYQLIRCVIIPVIVFLINWFVINIIVKNSWQQLLVKKQNLFANKLDCIRQLNIHYVSIFYMLSFALYIYLICGFQPKVQDNMIQLSFVFIWNVGIYLFLILCLSRLLCLYLFIDKMLVKLGGNNNDYNKDENSRQQSKSKSKSKSRSKYNKHRGVNDSDGDNQDNGSNMNMDSTKRLSGLKLDSGSPNLRGKNANFNLTNKINKINSNSRKYTKSDPSENGEPLGVDIEYTNDINNLKNSDIMNIETDKEFDNENDDNGNINKSNDNNRSNENKIGNIDDVTDTTVTDNLSSLLPNIKPQVIKRKRYLSQQQQKIVDESRKDIENKINNQRQINQRVNSNDISLTRASLFEDRILPQLTISLQPAQSKQGQQEKKMEQAHDKVNKSNDGRYLHQDNKNKDNKLDDSLRSVQSVESVVSGDIGQSIQSVTSDEVEVSNTQYTQYSQFTGSKKSTKGSYSMMTTAGQAGTVREDINGIGSSFDDRRRGRGASGSNARTTRSVSLENGNIIDALVGSGFGHGNGNINVNVIGSGGINSYNNRSSVISNSGIELDVDSLLNEPEKAIINLRERNNFLKTQIRTKSRMLERRELQLEEQKFLLGKMNQRIQTLENEKEQLMTQLVSKQDALDKATLLIQVLESEKQSWINQHNS